VGDIHNIISLVGADEAKKMADSKLARQCFDIGAAVMGDDEFGMNVLHSGFAMCSLPHRSTPDLVWERSGGPNQNLTLLVESGYWTDKRPVGLPSGSVARLILIYLSTEATKTRNPIVELGPNMTSFLDRMGISNGGKSRQLVREQCLRLSMCSLTFFARHNVGTNIRKGSFIKNAFVPAEIGVNQLSFWQPTVQLDDAFFEEITQHPLPLREAAIRQLSSKSMALDLYVFLAYRCHSLKGPTQISWTALYRQFGAGFSEQRVFVYEVKKPLSLALAAYPEARVEVTPRGLTLHPSESPVPKVLPKFGRRVVG